MRRFLLLLTGNLEGGPEMNRLVEAVRQQVRPDRVGVACLPPGSPSLSEGIAAAVRSGATCVVILPCLMAPAQEILDGIFQAGQDAARTFPGVQVVAGSPLGSDDRLPGILHDLARTATERGEGPGERVLLTLEGRVAHPLRLTFADLLSLPGQVEDVSAMVTGRQGSGVFVRTLLEAASPEASTGQVTFHAEDDAFSATVSLTEAGARGILIYRLGSAPLPERLGGPVRLIIPQGEDACNNVKQVVRLEVG